MPAAYAAWRLIMGWWWHADTGVATTISALRALKNVAVAVTQDAGSGGNDVAGGVASKRQRTFPRVAMPRTVSGAHGFPPRRYVVRVEPLGNRRKAQAFTTAGLAA